MKSDIFLWQVASLLSVRTQILCKNTDYVHQLRIALRYLQKEFPVVLDNFFEVLYAGGDPRSQQLAQSCRRMFQPMFESPHISFHLET